jgi:hypothetical protein
MEPEGSPPHSQQPATCPYPEPDRSSPCPPPPFRRLEDPFWYYPPIYAWVFQVGSFPQVSSLKPYMHLSSPLYVLHVLPIPVVLTSSPEWDLLRSTEHKAPCYAVFSTPRNHIIPDVKTLALYFAWIPVSAANIKYLCRFANVEQKRMPPSATWPFSSTRNVCYRTSNLLSNT